MPRFPSGPRDKGRARTPTVLQMEAVECGAASLGSLLAYYGLFVPLEELRAACGVSRDGAKASKVVQAARTYGMDAKGMRMGVEQALEHPTPFIAFWGFNHFVVIEGATSKEVFLNDPAMGPRRISMKEFNEKFTGVVLAMQPGEDFEPGGKPPSIWPALSARLRNSRSALFYVMGATLLLIVPGILQPALLKVFVDDVLVRGFNTWIFPLIIGLILAGILNGILTYLQQQHFARMNVKLGIASAGEFFWHVLRLPVGFYAQRFAGDIANRVQSCQRMAALLSGPLPTNAVNVLSAVFFLAVMFFYSAILTVAVIGLTALNLLALKYWNRRQRDLNSSMLNQSAMVMGASMAGLQAIETLKAMGTENEFFAKWAGYQTKTVNTNQEIGGISTWFNAVPSLLEQFTTTAVLAGGAYLIIEGQLTIGGLVAFQALLKHFTTPVTALLSFNSQLQEIQGDLNRLDDVLRNPQDETLLGQLAAEADHGEQDMDRLSGAVEIRDLTFGFNPGDPPLIKDFSISLAPGRRVALVGGSGSGKSTIGKLILGLYQPWSGDVLYDGKPIKEIPRSVFTTSVASVDQEIVLFKSTVAENLSLWDPTIPRDDIVQAAKDAQIHQDVGSRPGGYESMVAEQGGNFSGGQRQRLEIARALVRNPSVVVLDEATAALDPATEQRVDDNLRRRGCTCIIVAHRLSTIRDCDEIIVLENGSVIERGNHDALMDMQGRYAQLVSLQ